MVYVTDGSVHHDGVQNEKDMSMNLNLLNHFQKLYPQGKVELVKRGGTQSVIDLDIRIDGENVEGCSIKLHRNGTFDHINTTNRVDEVVPDLVKQIAELKKTHRGDEASLPLVRKSLNAATNDSFEKIGSETISDCLKQIHDRAPKWMIVKEKTQISVFDHLSMEELSKYPYDGSTTYFLKKAASAQTSRQVWRETNGVKVNTDLRLRLVLNNGVTALLGLSKANKNSVLTMKIQQDQVNRLLQSVDRTVVSLA
jgi:hypothetical protein